MARPGRLARRLALKCGAPTRWRDGRSCRQLAGWRTRHPGVGPCRAHGTRAQHEAWRWAMDVARELQVTPWDALLLATRRAAGRVAWVDQQLVDATRRHDGAVDAPEVRRWLKESRLERALLARTAKAAVDAGVAERLVRQVELEGQLVAEVLGRTLDALGLNEDQRVEAFAVAQRELLALDAAADQR